MEMQWTTFFGLCLLVSVVNTVLLPEQIYQCYRHENYALFNRHNRQGMSVDQLIGLIEKLEHSDHGRSMSVQRMATVLLWRFRYDGIIDKVVNQNSQYLDPYTIIQPENAKYQMLQRLIPPGNRNEFPENDFTLEEKCTFHWMLSHSVNETQRDDEDDFCQVQARRRRRASQRYSGSTGYSSRTSYGGRTGTGGSSSSSGQGFTGNIADEDASNCPLELGVVYSPYGPVATGTLLAGIAAGMSQQDVSVEDVVGASTVTLQLLAPAQRQLSVNNLWAATLAGDIAQTALHYEGGTAGGSRHVIGPKGYWNSTYCPREYSLEDRLSVTALTNAEIYGGIDGYLIGSQISSWSRSSSLKLSNILRMYYSPDGVSYDRPLRACDRLRNFQNSDLFNQDQLLTQSTNFAFAYYAMDLGRMPTVSQDNLEDGMSELVSAVITDVTNFAGGSMVDDGPGCQNVPNPGTPVTDPVCDTKADVVAVIDPTQGQSSIQAQKVFLSELALAMDIGWNRSYIQVMSGHQGEVLLDKWNHTNKAKLACDIQTLDMGFGGRADMSATLDQVSVYYSDLMNREDNDVLAKTNTQILLLMYTGSRLDNEDDVVDKLNALCDSFPDLNIFTLTDNANSFNGVRDRMDRRQFVQDNMFSSETSDKNIRDVLVPQMTTRMCSLPSRFVYPRCNPDEYSYSYNENGHEYIGYIEPGKVTYLKMGAQQFLSSQDLHITFEATYGSVQVCASRSDMNPADGNDDVNCQATDGTSTRKIEFDFSQPCDEDHMNDDCSPIYFSIQQADGSASTNSYSNMCADEECPYPDSIKFTITHENMRCNSAGALAASVLLLLLATAARLLAN